MLTQPIA